MSSYLPPSESCSAQLLSLTSSKIQKMAAARVPTEHGEFQLLLYRDGHGKDHLAFTLGDVSGQEGLLVRLHSECFTGDVLGSLRCDCGPQLHYALGLIGQAGRGVLLYLRQEGRGIGLLDKLRAYNLQDLGFDTVDANLELGHLADAREYSVAALMLQDLGVNSIDLITNNPRKIEGVAELGIQVRQRVPLQLLVGAEGAAYMDTKMRRMDHWLYPSVPGLRRSAWPSSWESWLDSLAVPVDRPLVTLAFAQSLAGNIAAQADRQLPLSGPESQLLTHRLRSSHDGILLGIGTLLADDPLLTARLVAGPSPRPIVIDSSLRFPLTARLLDHPSTPWVATGPQHDVVRRQALQGRGVSVMEVPVNAEGSLNLRVLLALLRHNGVQRLMVEGGSRVLNSFLRAQLADLAVVTIAPSWGGGLPGIGKVGSDSRPMPRLTQAVWENVGKDMVMWAALDWTSP